jgi:hemolysin activation/secretion protein
MKVRVVSRRGVGLVLTVTLINLHSAALAALDPTVAPESEERRVEILEYRIEGANLLSQSEVEAAVYPFLGPDKGLKDVEDARAALEKAYTAKGFQTVGVEIPPQQVKGGIVTLKVVEGKIGRLRVKGSRYFDLDEIKDAAPSLKEGTVPNFDAVSADIVALNQIPDRRVTPALKAGVRPGTVDVDLNVDDTFPLHASLELNNRYSKDTTKLRLNGSVHYDNLWQMGHSLTLGYQVAPSRAEDGEVYSGSYLARFASVPWLSLLGYAVKQESDVSTLGIMNVAGKGDIIGARAIISLPPQTDFYHTLSVGLDRKRFQERVTLEGAEGYATPITYWPVTGAYAATWMGTESTTQLNAAVTFNLRPAGSQWEEFDNKRYKASGGFFYFRGDVSRTQELPLETQGFAKVQGQLSNDALISSEQFSAGGLDTVRGYLESEALGDTAMAGTAELRTPSLTQLLGDDILNEWRFHLFLDGARLAIKHPLEEQRETFTLWSYGVGTRIKLLDHINSTVDLGIPMIAQESTKRGSPRLHFRLWGEF